MLSFYTASRFRDVVALGLARYHLHPAIRPNPLVWQISDIGCARGQIFERFERPRRAPRDGILV